MVYSRPSGRLFCVENEIFSAFLVFFDIFVSNHHTGTMK